MPESGLGGTSRPRTYIIFARKGAYKLLHCPLVLCDYIAEELRSTAFTRPRDFLTATPLEIKLEAEDVCRTRGVTFRPGTIDLEYILNPREQRAIDFLNKRYMAMFNKPAHLDLDLCYFLGDNPEFMTTWSATSRKIPALRRNSATGKLWFPSVSRWMTAAERLLGEDIVADMKWLSFVFLCILLPCSSTEALDPRIPRPQLHGCCDWHSAPGRARPETGGAVCRQLHVVQHSRHYSHGGPVKLCFY